MLSTTVLRSELPKCRHRWRRLFSRKFSRVCWPGRRVPAGKIKIEQSAGAAGDFADIEEPQAIGKRCLVGRDHGLAEIGFELCDIFDGPEPGARYEHRVGAIVVDRAGAAIGNLGRTFLDVADLRQAAARATPQATPPRPPIVTDSVGWPGGGVGWGRFEVNRNRSRTAPRSCPGR